MFIVLGRYDRNASVAAVQTFAGPGHYRFHRFVEGSRGDLIDACLLFRPHWVLLHL